MAAKSTTAETILAAAQRSIRQRGPQKLSLSAVATEAGVSRPTVYRWFPTKTLLLAAIAAHEVEQFDVGLQQLADSHDDPAARFDAALHYLVAYLDETIGPDAISADPAFSLQSLADSLGPHIESVARVLGDALDEIPTVRSGALDEGARCGDAPAGGVLALLGAESRHRAAPRHAPDLRRRRDARHFSSAAFGLTPTIDG